MHLPLFQETVKRAKPRPPLSPSSFLYLTSFSAAVKDNRHYTFLVVWEAARLVLSACICPHPHTLGPHCLPRAKHMPSVCQRPREYKATVQKCYICKGRAGSSTPPPFIFHLELHSRRPGDHSLPAGLSGVSGGVH